MSISNFPRSNPEEHPEYERLMDLPWALEIPNPDGEFGLEIPGLIQIKTPDFVASLRKQNEDGSPNLRISDYGAGENEVSQLAYGALRDGTKPVKKIGVISSLEAPFEAGDLVRVSLALPLAEALVDYIQSRLLQAKISGIRTEFEAVVRTTFTNSSAVSSLAIQEALQRMGEVVRPDESFTIDAADKLAKIGVEYVVYVDRHGWLDRDLVPVSSFLDGHLIGDDSVFDNPDTQWGGIKRSGLI